MSEYWKINKHNFWLGTKLIISALILISIFICTTTFLINYLEDTYYQGYYAGWDDANQGIINVLDKYSYVTLAWSNGTEVGLKVEEYYDSINHFVPFNAYPNKGLYPVENLSEYDLGTNTLRGEYG